MQIVYVLPRLYQLLRQKYGEYFLFNRDILVSGTAAILIAAFVAQAYSLFDNSSLNNSIIALLVEYGIYIPFFAFLFYRNNRQKYVDQNGKRMNDILWLDIKKLFATFSVAELVYISSKGYIHFQIIVNGFEPYQASMISSVIAGVIFFVCINVGARIVRLFKK